MTIQNRDSVEFYDGAHLLAQAWSSMVPPVGAQISIRREVWTVRRVTYALDHADEMHERGMRANVDLSREA
jgi:hypothetical protein